MVAALLQMFLRLFIGAALLRKSATPSTATVEKAEDPDSPSGTRLLRICQCDECLQYLDSHFVRHTAIKDFVVPTER